ncbi:MAG: hypothetical protein KA436_11340 [Oligoflexales bacterium]|nr:hypothetical protein [Oligoflexales bacterium]
MKNKISLIIAFIVLSEALLPFAWNQAYAESCFKTFLLRLFCCTSQRVAPELCEVRNTAPASQAQFFSTYAVDATPPPAFASILAPEADGPAEQAGGLSAEDLIAGAAPLPTQPQVQVLGTLLGGGVPCNPELDEPAPPSPPLIQTPALALTSPTAQTAFSSPTTQAEHSPQPSPRVHTDLRVSDLDRMNTYRPPALQLRRSLAFHYGSPH